MLLFCVSLLLFLCMFLILFYLSRYDSELFKLFHDDTTIDMNNEENRIKRKMTTQRHITIPHYALAFWAREHVWDYAMLFVLI